MGTVTVAWCDRLLATVWDSVAETGIAAAAADAGLRTAVVRHESEVRAWLHGQGVAVTRQSIAGYAAVLLAAASRCGRRLPTDPHRYDWSNPEWYVVRLVALSAIARRDDTIATPDDRAAPHDHTALPDDRGHPPR